jgi:hypothetical protein
MHAVREKLACRCASPHTCRGMASGRPWNKGADPMLKSIFALMLTCLALMSCDDKSEAGKEREERQVRKQADGALIKEDSEQAANRAFSIDRLSAGEYVTPLCRQRP